MGSCQVVWRFAQFRMAVPEIASKKGNNWDNFTKLKSGVAFLFSLSPLVLALYVLFPACKPIFLTCGDATCRAYLINLYKQILSPVPGSR